MKAVNPLPMHFPAQRKMNHLTAFSSRKFRRMKPMSARLRTTVTDNYRPTIISQNANIPTNRKRVLICRRRKFFPLPQIYAFTSRACISKNGAANWLRRFLKLFLIFILPFAFPKMMPPSWPTFSPYHQSAPHHLWRESKPLR